MKFAFAIATLAAGSSVSDTNLTPYPGYSGDLSVTGTVGAYLYNNDAYIWYNIAGLEADCATVPEGVANACGIHIHEGTTCDDADSVGGHYYDGDSISSDPWSPVTYQASADGTSKGKTSATIGAAQDINGRSIVVHDKTGARVACALIEGKLTEYVTSDYKCQVCAHVYDSAADGAGVAFEDLADDWTCPVCGQPKSAYVPASKMTNTLVEADYKCQVCAHVYDAAADGAGVAFEDLADDWKCPVCGQPKSAYVPASQIETIFTV